MSKNSISVQRSKLRSEIKELINKYELIKLKEGVLGVLGSYKQEQLFELINSIGMRYAKDGYLDRAQVWLKKAEPIALKYPKFQIIWLNNMACVFKKKPDFKSALSCLQRSEFLAQEMRRKSNENVNYDRLLIDCWLNLSALFSSENRHEQALKIIQNGERFIQQKLSMGYQKFTQQMIIAKYNKTVQLQYLGKVEQAYCCNEQIRKILYDKRIYRHFLQKKVNEMHQDLRKRLINESKHKKSVSIAVSVSKIRHEVKSVQTETEGHLESHFQSKVEESRCNTSRRKKEGSADFKENYNTVGCKVKYKENGASMRVSQKRRSIAHIPASLSSLPVTLGQVGRRIMCELGNRNV